jgi:general secretion pathway protein N
MSLKLKKLVLVLVCYLLLLAGNAPAGVVRVFMPADIKAGRFSGSLWQGRVYQLTWRNVTIEDVHWQLTFSSWRPAIKVALRDPRGLQGTGTLRGWHDLEWYEWQLSAPADFVRQQLSLALAMTLKGGCSCNCTRGVYLPWLPASWRRHQVAAGSDGDASGRFGSHRC